LAKLSKNIENKIRNKTTTWAKTMKLDPTTLKVIFEELSTDVDAKTIPYYYPGADGKPKNTTFEITYNIAFLNANKNNLESDGVIGAIIHELCHCKHFLVDIDGYTNHPHTDSYFKNNLKKYMKIAGDGIHDYADGYRPDLKIDAAIRMRRNAVAPNWLDRYWVYMCKDCGFVNSFISDLRSTQPNKCEKCGSTNLIKTLAPPERAAKFETNPRVKNSKLSKNERDKLIVGVLLNYLKGALKGKDLVDYKKVIATKYKDGRCVCKPKNAILSGGLMSAKSTFRKGKRKQIDTIHVNRFV